MFRVLQVSVLGLLAGCAAPDTKFSADPAGLAELGGTWRATAVTAGGKASAADRVRDIQLRYVFEGDRVTVRRPGEPDAVNTVKVDPSSPPKRMMIEGEFRTPSVYKVEGDTLTLSMAMGDKAGFPAGFDSTASPVVDVIVFQREPAPKPPDAKP